jgi:tetratricopeptide (TPR) repeat protein
VQSFAQVDGESIALAQLLPRAAEESESDDDVAEVPPPPSARGPVEAFVPPHAWKDLTRGASASSDVSYVVTGAFEPPTEGRGLIQLLVFDAKDGRTRARVEVPVDGERAGRALLEAFEEAWSTLGGELGGVREIDDLSWEALESVLLAERCALHDPRRGGPHDRLAALVHLGRAIGDAPDARFPASRLASLALDVAVGSPSDERLEGAALRALTRATEDAPDNPDLLEAIAALSLRRGDPQRAEQRAREAIALAPERARLYALLSEALRAKDDLEGALGAIEEGILCGANDPLLGTERGIVLAERGKSDDAERALRLVLTERPFYPPAFTNLASLLMEKKDVVAATQLVDDVLAARAPHPEVLRRAIQLTIAVEPDGIARASRVARLAETLSASAPDDAWAHLVLARALAQTGDRVAAAARLRVVMRVAGDSPMAAEAQRGLLALGDPKASLEVDAVLRAAYNAPIADLETIAARARAIGNAHDAWAAWLAAGIAERRRESWRAAREALEQALSLAPGCTPAHMELSGVLVATADVDLAVDHARKACTLEGETARTLAVLATALLASGARNEAQEAIERALTLDANDEANRALAERIRRRRSSRPSVLTKLRAIFSGRAKR